MRNYVYNGEFLAQWIQENAIEKNKVAEAMGTYATSLDRWLKNKEKPIKLQCIMSFCNAMDVDISSFFLDGGKSVTMKVKPVKGKRSRDANQNDNIEQIKQEYEARIRQIESEHRQVIAEIKLAHNEEMMKEVRDNRAREDAIRSELGERIKELEEEIKHLISATKVSVFPDPSHKSVKKG